MIRLLQRSDIEVIHVKPIFENSNYKVYDAAPATGIIYRINNFISGHIRVRGKKYGQYPFKYLEMIDRLFGSDYQTIEVCSGWVSGKNQTFSDSITTVDINKARRPDIVDDAQTLSSVENDKFTRVRIDPPYNTITAEKMYKTKLPDTSKLLKSAARVCCTGSLIFLLLGPVNYQSCPEELARIGLIFLTVVPNSEIRCLNIYQKVT